MAASHLCVVYEQRTQNQQNSAVIIHIFTHHTCQLDQHFKLLDLSHLTSVSCLRCYILLILQINDSIIP